MQARTGGVAVGGGPRRFLRRHRGADPAVGADFFEVSRPPSCSDAEHPRLGARGFAALTVLGATLLGAGRPAGSSPPWTTSPARRRGWPAGTCPSGCPPPRTRTWSRSSGPSTRWSTPSPEDRARRGFTADVSHELSSPLTTLTTSVRLPERRGTSCPRPPASWSTCSARRSCGSVRWSRPAGARPLDRPGTARRANGRSSTPASWCARRSSPAVGPPPPRRRHRRPRAGHRRPAPARPRPGQPVRQRRPARCGCDDGTVGAATGPTPRWR